MIRIKDPILAQMLVRGFKEQAEEHEIKASKAFEVNNLVEFHNETLLASVCWQIVNEIE